MYLSTDTQHSTMTVTHIRYGLLASGDPGRLTLSRAAIYTRNMGEGCCNHMEPQPSGV